MKIAYILHLNGNPQTSGVYKKIISQTKVWSCYGNDVGIFQITKDEISINFDSISCKIFRYHPNSKYQRLISVWNLVYKELKSFNPDVVYVRYDLYSPVFCKIKKKIPIIVEVNTNDLKEYCLQFNFRCFYNFLTRWIFFFSVSGIVFVSYEISNLLYFKVFNKPHIVIGNEIDLSLYHALPPTNNISPNIVFIGSEGQVWHGVDKILKLAKMRPGWQFHMVGILSNDTELSNVKFYGQIPREDYEKIFEKADIAIGSLALHRIRVNEISPLKVREYLAFGIPTIIGYKDTDFLNKAPFILEIPNTEENIEISIQKIDEFINFWKGKRVPREEILHLDPKKKERLRLSFFEKILNFRKRNFGDENENSSSN